MPHFLRNQTGHKTPNPAIKHKTKTNPRTKTLKSTHLLRNMASSRAHLRLDSWWPRPSQESQCFPGQSILSPQYKYFSCPLWILSWLLRLLGLKTIFKVFEEEENEKPLVDIRVEKRYKRAMAAMARVKKRIWDLGFGLGFVGLWNAIGIGFAEKERRRRWMKRTLKSTTVFCVFCGSGF